ncbi:MAG: tagaturonate reductase [Ginsengibacter sp.]
MTENISIEVLNWETIKKYTHEFGIKDDLIQLPEKIIQFGTGMLLRALVDYLIDKANKKNCFNGRVVLIKSTGNSIEEFTRQNNLYTVLEKGTFNGKPSEQKNIVACISRVLPAQQQWKQILQCAADPHIEIVVSNTTEAGLVFNEEVLSNEAPKSFPAKLTAYLYQRYKTFDGEEEKGMVILPTELVSENGQLLKQFVSQHATNNNLPREFIDWVNNHNHFCDTLVDRIVPGRSEKDDVISWNNNIKYTDHLHTTTEPYLLWAIKGNDTVKQKLSFIEADNRALVAESIEGFKEQKLRILNGSNTTVVAPAYLAGLNTVHETVTDKLFAAFTQQLIDQEILPTIIKEYPTAEAFAKEVMDRFANPFVQYPLLNIALQYSSKMNSRNAASIIRNYKVFNKYPPLMSIGLASFFLFYTPARKEDGTWSGIRNDERYLYRDEHATFLCSTLEGVDWHDIMLAERAVSTIINNHKIFSPELASLPGLAKMIAELCSRLLKEGIRKTIEKKLKQSNEVRGN